MKTDSFKAHGIPNSAHVGPLEAMVSEKLSKIRSGMPPALAATNRNILECLPWEVDSKTD